MADKCDADGCEQPLAVATQDYYPQTGVTVCGARLCRDHFFAWFDSAKRNRGGGAPIRSSPPLSERPKGNDYGA